MCCSTCCSVRWQHVAVNQCVLQYAVCCSVWCVSMYNTEPREQQSRCLYCEWGWQEQRGMHMYTTYNIKQQWLCKNVYTYNTKTSYAYIYYFCFPRQTFPLLYLEKKMYTHAHTSGQYHVCCGCRSQKKIKKNKGNLGRTSSSLIVRRKGVAGTNPVWKQ